jgi:FixJ family two-component response regulator
LSEQAANSRFCELRFLQKDEEYELVENELKTNQSSPAIVIFGGLHVALQHGYLQSLRFRSAVAKVLVMDHVSAEVMEMAINLCGLSIFIEAPFTPTQLLTVLKKFLSESSKHTTERMQHLERELESSKERERDLHAQLTKALQQQHPPQERNNRPPPPPHRTHNGL